MTTPNIDLNTELYLPKTYVFERKSGTSYNTVAYMTEKMRPNFTYVNLPPGMSMVTVTATALQSGYVRVFLTGKGGYKEQLNENTYTGGAPVVRLWAGTISSSGTDLSSGGLRIMLEAERVTSSGMATGSVSVQIINFPPEGY